MKRLHMEPLPSSDPIPSVLRFVSRAMGTSKVQRIEISPKGVLVEREMSDPDEPVVAGGTDDVDHAFLLNQRINLMALPFDPEQHAVYALYDAAKMLEKEDREVFSILVPSWPLFAAWLGVEEGTPPKAVFGMKMALVPKNITNERVILLGAKPMSIFLSDVDMGVAIDLGV